MSIAAAEFKVNEKFMAGGDAGGTKVCFKDTISSDIHRFSAPDYPDMYAVLEDYFLASKARPRKVVIAIGGIRDDETGDVHVTNVNWPVFSPGEAEHRYPGTLFETVHDLAGTAAGALNAVGVDLHQLKGGIAKKHGPIITVTIGTGVGVCVAFWDAKTRRRILFSGEAGHIGFQPFNEAERRHLAYLFTQHDYPSVELAINGKHGVESWLKHSPELKGTNNLSAAIERAIASDRPVGAVLLEYAIEGSGNDQTAAHSVLSNMGALVGSVLADFALAYRSTGGIYLTGSVSLGLSEYWAENTDFIKAFMRHGTPDHASWMGELLENIPIYLLTDPHVAASGTLALAKEL